MNKPSRQASPTVPANAPAAEYTIDELARAAGATVRNVRAYLERGLLPPASRRRRAAIYTDVHIARLRVIADLLSRGYTLTSIAELLDAWEKGWDLKQVIHVETILATPWEHESSLTVPRGELDALFGVAVTGDELAAMAALEWIQPEAEHVRIPYPRILRAAGNIVTGGVPLAVLLARAVTLRAQMEQVAETMSMMVVDGIIVPHARGGLPSAADLPRLTEAVRTMRPLAEPLVSAELVRALEQVATRYLGDRLIAALAPTLAPAADAPPASPSPAAGAAKSTARSPGRRR